MKLIRSSAADQSRHVTPIAIDSFTSCKRAFSTRNVPVEAMLTLVNGDIRPKSGDLVLARVDRLRQHLRLEQPEGRRAKLFRGDHVLVCYGNRYAPDQYESIVPDNLAPCDLVAAGGIASRVRHRHPAVKRATQISPLGLVGDKTGSVLNVGTWRIKSVKQSRRDVPLFAVVGSSMNAGKTTTAARIVRGLVLDGFKVGAMKVTGTGSGGDLWHFLDAGACCALDFTDAGYATTYGLSHKAIIEIVDLLGSSIRNQSVDAIVVEIADGLSQVETHDLLCNAGFRKQVNGVFHAAADVHSAIYGVDYLQKLDYNLIAISGVMSSSPLARREFISARDVPVYTKNELCTPGFGSSLIESVSIKASNRMA